MEVFDKNLVFFFVKPNTAKIKRIEKPFFSLNIECSNSYTVDHWYSHSLHVHKHTLATHKNRSALRNTQKYHTVERSKKKSCTDKVSVGTVLNVCVHSVALVCLCSVYMYSHSKRVFISVFICFFSTFILCSCNFLTYLYPTEIHSRTDIFQDVAMIVILFFIKTHSPRNYENEKLFISLQKF